MINSQIFFSNNIFNLNEWTVADPYSPFIAYQFISMQIKCVQRFKSTVSILNALAVDDERYNDFVRTGQKIDFP